MIRKLLLALALAGSMVAFVSCETKGKLPVDSVNTKPIAMGSDFDKLVGETWRGTLTYLDYSSNKLTSIRSTLRVTAKEKAAWVFAMGYDDEPQADGASEIRIEDGGTVIHNGETIEPVVMRAQRGSEVEVITEFAGVDDNRKAIIRRKYIIGKDTFSMRKMVKFEGAADFFKRHEYMWTR